MNTLTLFSCQKIFFLISLCIVTKTTSMMMVPNKESFYIPTEYAKNKLYYEACLRTAALNDDDWEMRKLMNIDINFHAKDELGNSALHYAALTGSTTTGETLLQNGIDANIQNNKRKTPLHIAMRIARNSTFVGLLLKYGADQTIKNNKGIRPDNYIEFYIGMNDTEKQFIKEAHKLFLYRRLEQLQITQKNPQSIEKYEIKLRAAAKMNKLATIIRLINNNVNIDAKNKLTGYTALHYAVRNGFLNIIRILLQNGAYVNIQNNDKYTPLHLATNSYSIDIVNLLLEFGADQSIKNNKRERPDNKLTHNIGYTPAEGLEEKDPFLTSVHQTLLYARLQELTESESPLTLTVSFDHFPIQS